MIYLPPFGNKISWRLPLLGVELMMDLQTFKTASESYSDWVHKNYQPSEPKESKPNHKIFVLDKKI